MHVWGHMAGGGRNQRLNAITDEVNKDGFSFGKGPETPGTANAPATPPPAAPTHPVDDAIEGLRRQLDAVGAHPPAPVSYPKLTGPNLAQLGLALGAGLMRPRLAPQAATIALQAGLRQHADAVATANAENARRQAGWNDQMRSLQGELGAAERAHASQDRSSGGERKGRDDNPIVPSIHLGMFDPGLHAHVARTLEETPGLAKAVRAYHAASPADRAKLRARYVHRGKLPLFGTMHDDVLDHFGTLTPDEIHRLAHPDESPKQGDGSPSGILEQKPLGGTKRTLVAAVHADARDHLRLYPENRPQVAARLKDLGIPLD